MKPSSRFLQSALLKLYGAIQATGLLDTAAGRRLFQWSYGHYKQRFEAQQIRRLQQFVTAGSCVIDVGANIGFYTTRLAQWVSGGGQVIALEPDPSNFSQLQQILRRSGIESRVDLIQGAAAETTGTLHLARNPDHPGDHKLGEEGLAIAAYRIDDLLAQRDWPQVSLIKIDVQGAELRVLRGARATLERFHPALQVEIDPQALKASGFTAEELFGELDACGYRCYDLSAKDLSTSLTSAEEALATTSLGYGDFLFLAQRPTPAADPA